MAENFINLRVSLTLSPPDNYLVYGTVKDVRDSQLYLADVTFSGSPVKLAWTSYSGSQIADIQVIPDLTPATPTPHGLTLLPTTSTQNVQAQHAGIDRLPQISPHQSDFQDPAILGYTRPPATTTLAELPQHASPRPPPTSELSSANLDRSIASAVRLRSRSPTKNASKIMTKTAEASQVMTTKLEADEADVKTKKARRRRKTKVAGQGDVESSPELARTKPVKSKAQNGWRETPMLEERKFLEPPEEQQKPRSKKSKAQMRRQKELSQSGWATEDVTDVQEMGDFDFESNLKEFDKRTVFEQIRNDDTTADEDLLVTINRTNKPSAAMKLRPTENVLAPQREALRSPSGEDEATWANGISDRTGSIALPIVKGKSSIRSNSSNAATATPFDMNPGLPFDGSSMSGHTSTQTAAGTQPALRYLHTNQQCDAFDYELLQDIEDYAVEKMGLSPDLIMENAGRCVAEIVMATINPGGRRIGHGNHNAQPLVVLLLGDHRASACALVAGRHLQERGVRVVAGVVHPDLLEDDDELVTWGIGEQMARFGRNQVMSWDKTSMHLKTLDAPPELIIDALYGKTNAWNILETDPDPVANATALQMMAWANKSSASVLAIDIPAGVDLADGSVKMYEGELAEIRAKMVVCCGAPLVGLLRAVKRRHDDGQDWRVHVCDSGINRSLQRMTKGVNRSGKGKSIDFNAKWHVPLIFGPP